MNPYPIRVLIADDSAVFRSVVRTMLDAELDIEVIAEASDGEEAVALATEFTPNVVLLDVRMPRLTGIDAARALNEIHPSVKILMLTVSDETEDLFDAVKAGASGYLIKDVDPGEIADAVRRIHSGQAVLSPAVASVLLPALAATLDADDLSGERFLLTNRERQVLERLAAGSSSAQAAAKLQVSEAAVNSHINNVLMKLHAHTRSQTEPR